MRKRINPRRKPATQADVNKAKKRKLNGEIMTYQINKPITWVEFRKYPEDIQIEYFKHFADTHGCTVSMLAEALGTNVNCLSSYIATTRKGLKGILHKRATPECRVAFSKWLRGDTEQDETEAVCDTEDKSDAIKEELEEKKLMQFKNADCTTGRGRLPEMPYVNTIQAGTFSATGRAMDIGQTLYRMFQDVEIRAVISFEVVGDAKT